jgi:hypothetical protein
VSYNDARAPAKPGFAAVAMIGTLSEIGGQYRHRRPIRGPCSGTTMGGNALAGDASRQYLVAMARPGHTNVLVGVDSRNSSPTSPGFPRESGLPEAVGRAVVEAMSRHRPRRAGRRGEAGGQARPGG